ncbi:chloroplastic protein [Glycine max]|nr:chloroplastic protein [Glycine max]
MYYIIAQDYKYKFRSGEGECNTILNISQIYNPWYFRCDRHSHTQHNKSVLSSVPCLYTEMASMSTCITVIPTCGLPRRLLSFTPKQPISLPCVIGGVPKRVWDSRVLVARPGGAVESDKLPSDVRKRTMDAVDGCGGRVTIGDVASRAGLNLNQAQKALQALAADADGFLEVSGEGDVLYVFPKDYRSRLGAKSFRIKAEPFFEKAKAAGEYLIRVSFGTALIASIVIVYTTIIALVTSSRSEEDNRGRRGGRSYDSGFTFYFNPVDLFWYWDPYYYRRRRLQADDDKMNFIESVFSFVFGDGDPNQGIEEERWKLIGQYIASNGGVVAAEELAPYLDIDSTEGIKFYQLVSELRSWSVESLMVTKANARMEMRMGAMEKAIEENREAVELRLSSIEGMIQWLAAAWEKKSPAMNVHTVDVSGGDEGIAAHDSNRWRNLEMPIFDGDDPMVWLTKIKSCRL